MIYFARFQAVDEDDSQTVTFTVSSDVTDMFSVTGNSIVLSQPLDYEVQSVYTVSVTAQDSGSPPKQVNITVP